MEMEEIRSCQYKNVYLMYNMWMEIDMKMQQLLSKETFVCVSHHVYNVKPSSKYM